MTPPGSKQRMLQALNRRPPDYLPCCFMSFTALRRRVVDNITVDAPRTWKNVEVLIDEWRRASSHG